MREHDREDLEARIDRWRTHALGRGVPDSDIAAREDRMREHASGLIDAGLDADEALLVALKRVSDADLDSRDFAHAYIAELWGDSAQTAAPDAPTAGFRVMLACALGAALAIKLPALFGVELDGPGTSFYARNLSLFVLPFLAALFVWKTRPGVRVIAGLAGTYIAAAVVANAYPFAPDGSTGTLVAIHLPIALWLAIGVAHAGGEWRVRERRMEYVRFTGEWLVNYALIALGGGVLMALAMGIFEALGIDASVLISEWVMPCGAAAAVVVAGWLAGTHRNPAGGMAPMLARVFSPLFALMLVALLVGVISTGGVIDIEREVLILLDVLLVVVLALVLYGVSARGSRTGPGLLDRIQLVLVGCALAVDAVALVNIVARLAEYGLSPNRVAAVGLNIILLLGLGWSAVLQTGVVRMRRERAEVESWHMRYLPVYAVWAALVAVAFPLLFGFA